ncbi:MAG: hypothetical protein ABF649_02215 [Bacillus sp. (in: firmicutes)]
MLKSVKHQLDQSIPDDITLTEGHKQKIMNKAHERLNRKNSLRFRLVKPLLSTIAIIGLFGILTGPSVQKWMEERQVQQFSSKQLEKVTITDVEYSSLIRSIYVKDTNEFVYIDKGGIFAYSVQSDEKKVLVKPKENMSIFDIAVNKNWLVWLEDNSNTVYALNRQNDEMKKLTIKAISDFQLDEDTFLYRSYGENGESVGYKSMNLTTMIESEILEATGIGSNSIAAVQDGLMVIPEQYRIDNKIKTTYFLYDLHKKKQIAAYDVPYDSVVNVTLTDHKIYAELSNEGEIPILAYIDLADGKLHQVKTPKFDAYAVFKDFVALSIPSKGSNTVKLYRMKKDKIVALPTFNQVKERLVKPRFTNDGALVVNGEGKDYAMYVQDVK